MTIKIDLRTEAEAEAARIRAIKARPLAEASRTQPSGVPATALRRATAAGLHRPAAVFFTRTRIVDGSGRMIEELMIPVEVAQENRGLAQHVFDRWHALVRSVCLAEVAKRMTDLATEYRQGLRRARARESQLADLIDADRLALAQPGLFDRRPMKDRGTVAVHGRRESLDTASSLLLAQRSDIVLLIMIG